MFLSRFHSECGHLVSATQFAFVTLYELPGQLEWKPPAIPILRSLFSVRLKRRLIPLHRWVIIVSLFFGVSFLNNLALAYNLPMPYHILFRSSGLVMSMIVCHFLVGKR